MPPDLSDLPALLRSERERLLPDTSGEVSSGTPALADSGTDCFALAAMTVDGTLSTTDQADLEFSLQSVVKPFIYAIALLDHGDEVHERIGVEPTGEPYDAAVLDMETGRPPNPMVNAGALLASSLVLGADVDARVERILDVCSRAAGRQLHVDERVAAEELEHGDRNRALGYLMKAGGNLPCSVEDAVRVMGRACSIAVTTADLAAMAATLAGWGRCPASGDDVLPGEVVSDVLSVMATCGMYDGAGRWVHRVGMPAKSGVSGALLAVAPGVAGIASFSAPLDPEGNSVRGVSALTTIAQEMRLHRFAAPAR